MRFELLETVVLNHDLVDHGLRCGDLGAIVELWPPDGVEVEFVSASGRTIALLTLSESEIRRVDDHDVLAVRSVA